MESDAVKSRLITFIRRHELGVIATASPQAIPEAALVNIAVTPEFEIMFETTAATRKCANLRDNPRVAMVVGWEEDQTLQIDGYADVPEGAARERLKEVFTTAFPRKASHAFWPGNDFYRVKPFWARFSNYNLSRKVEEFHFPENMPASVARRRWWRLFAARPERQRQRN